MSGSTRGAVPPMTRPTYVKRLRMELAVPRAVPEPRLPPGFGWRGWAPDLADAHAEALFRSFDGEMDAQLFVCFRTAYGCRELIRAIRLRAAFCPAATWLAVGPDGDAAGTVQGLRDGRGVGAVQNLGVVPAHRGRGVGAALLAAAVYGFRAVGARRVHLEVTADNAPAVRLYRAAGFRPHKIIYKPLAAADPAPVGAEP